MAWSAVGIGAMAIIVGLAVPWSGRVGGPIAVMAFGGSAIWLGVMAADRYRSVRGAVGGPAALGVALGGLAALSMIVATAVIVVGDAGRDTPASAYGQESPVADGTAPGSAAGSVRPMTEVPQAVSSPADAQEERMQVAMVAGSAATALERLQPAGGPWPASLAISSDGTLLIGPGGVALVNLPLGAEVVYSTSSDGMEFSLALVGTTFGSVATSDSTSDQVMTD